MRTNESKTLYEAFLQGATIDERAPALMYKGKTVSYKTFRKRVDALAAALIRGGINQGDTVAVSLPNMPKAAYVLYAVNKIGAVSYFQHVLNAPLETLAGLKRTGAKILFAMDTLIEPIRDECKSMGVKIVSCCPADELGSFVCSVYRRREKLKRPKKQKCGLNDLQDNYGPMEYNDFVKGASEKDTVSYYPTNPKNTAVMLDSGGTMGVPKTVELSAYAINALSETGPALLCEKGRKFSGRYMLSPLPIFHCYGLTMGLCAMTTMGGCNVLMPKFSKKDTLKYLKRGKINYMIGVPAVYDALMTQKKFNGKRLKGIETAFVGGDSLGEKTKAEFDRRMTAAGGKARLFEGYGLSETLSAVCVNTHDNNKAGSVGKPVPGAEIEIIDTDEFKEYYGDLGEETDMSREKDGIIPKDAKIGEICIGGDILMNSYYNDKVATDKAFFTDGRGGKLLRTGDAGYLDKDGFLYLIGRLKRIIKVSGESIFPIEIESAAREVEGVKACVATAVPDAKTGSRPALAIEAESGINKADLEKAVRRKLEKVLQKNAVPKEIAVLDALPLTKMNKIDFMSINK